MKHSKALDLARRYHFVLMDMICFEGKPSYLELKKTFNLYEGMIRKLYLDEIEKDIIECLEKLPTHDKWVRLTEKEIDQLNKELDQVINIKE